MNTISGRVVLKETGAGIPDVLVVIYDIDPGTDPEEVIPPPRPRSLASEAAGGGDRLGSVLTARDGSFELSYEDTEFQIWFGRFKRKSIIVSKSKEMVDLTMALFAKFWVNGNKMSSYSLFT